MLDVKTKNIRAVAVVLTAIMCLPLISCIEAEIKYYIYPDGSNKVSGKIIYNESTSAEYEREAKGSGESAEDLMKNIPGPCPYPIKYLFDFMTEQKISKVGKKYMQEITGYSKTAKQSVMGSGGIKLEKLKDGTYSFEFTYNPGNTENMPNLSEEQIKQARQAAGDFKFEITFIFPGKVLKVENLDSFKEREAKFIFDFDKVLSWKKETKIKAYFSEPTKEGLAEWEQFKKEYAESEKKVKSKEKVEDRNEKEKSEEQGKADSDSPAEIEKALKDLKVGDTSVRTDAVKILGELGAEKSTVVLKAFLTEMGFELEDFLKLFDGESALPIVNLDDFLARLAEREDIGDVDRKEILFVAQVNGNSSNVIEHMNKLLQKAKESMPNFSKKSVTIEGNEIVIFGQIEKPKLYYTQFENLFILTSSKATLRNMLVYTKQGLDKAIAKLLKDESAYVRISAVRALGKLKAEWCANEISKLLIDKDKCYIYDKEKKKPVETIVSAEAERVLKEWGVDVEKFKEKEEK